MVKGYTLHGITYTFTDKLKLARADFVLWPKSEIFLWYLTANRLPLYRKPHDV